MTISDIALTCVTFFQVLWKSYIDFEIEQEEYDNTRELYKRLLQRTQHVKVCIVSLHEHFVHFVQ